MRRPGEGDGSTSVRLGIGWSEDIPIATQQTLAAEVEDAGFRSLWTNEATGRDALLLCQAWALATTDLEVGVGVVPLWTRTPAQLGMASATLQEVSGGRFLLGLGTSHPSSMGSWHGADVRRPLTAASELLTILRQIETGHRTEVAGEVLRSERFRLQLDPLPPPTRRYLGAMGPRMLALAGQQADGVLLNWASVAEVARAGKIVRDAAHQVGRDANDVEVAAYVRVAVGSDEQLTRTALATQLASYALIPAYAAHLERQGYADTVSRVRAAREDGARGVELAPVVDDAALESLGILVTPHTSIRSVLDAYAAAGLDHLVLRVVAVEGDAVVDTVRAVISRFHAFV